MTTGTWQLQSRVELCRGYGCYSRPAAHRWQASNQKQRPGLQPKASKEQAFEEAVPGVGTLGLADRQIQEEGRLITCFRWPAALFGEDVRVTGSFNDWRAPLELRRSPENGDFVRSIPLQPGNHQYKYRVDGEWKTSPCEAITGDSQGQFNNQRVVAPSATFVWQAKWGGKDVFVTGDFVAWTELIPLELCGDVFLLRCSLPAGTYSYQFLVDGTWMTSPEASVVPDDDGHLCNRIVVQAPPAFRIFYATGWNDPVLHYRERTLSSNSQHSEWKAMSMARSPSRAEPQGGSWYMATVPATLSGEGIAQLDFFLSSQSKDREDRPVWGDTYLCPGPGGYKMEKGQMTPFYQATSPPTMLVSDLDGTMVGDGPIADNKTLDFSTYWESNAALAGGVLVYNTGRSLGGFISLIKEKAGALALPDVLITAVGTKIFLLENGAEGRGTAAEDSWKEDLQWAKRLDYGWNLEAVKQVAGRLVDELEPDGLCYWLDHGTEHPHRIALSVREDQVSDIVQRLTEAFEQQNILVRIIISGLGGWRYVDCVSVRGGKLEALEYVRSLFGVSRDRCVAAGDSGNDILMLEGDNKAIVVGNGQPTLVEWLLQQPQNGRIIYTDAEIAHGILEGIARHGLY